MGAIGQWHCEEGHVVGRTIGSEWRPGIVKYGWCSVCGQTTRQVLGYSTELNGHRVVSATMRYRQPVIV